MNKKVSRINTSREDYYEAMHASVRDALLWEENSVKLSGLIIDSELTFNSYVQMICKKASQKLTAKTSKYSETS